MTSPEFNHYNNLSPLESLGIDLTPEQRESVLNAVEQRAIEESEDHLPASQPSYEDDREYFIGWFWD